eukprot:Transcript_2516.p1 GENE.Transcript_2516~~Transcript_2516.p1  ORF type:complete len:411 (-),score=98.65 Transcript_2516:72-1304(-)
MRVRSLYGRMHVRSLSSLPYRIRVPLSKIQESKALSADGLGRPGGLGDGEALESHPSKPDYVRLALTSRVYDMVTETPLMHAAGLSARLAASVHVKREDLNPSFSFYIRGAYAKLAELQRQGCKGVVSVSVGSRGLALAHAAQRLGFPVTIVMPKNVPEERRVAVERQGARLVVAGTSLPEARAEATRLVAEEMGLQLFQSHDDPLIIAGQATAGIEILRQHSSMLSARGKRGDPRPPLDAIFLPVGGGSLLAGVAAAVKQLSPAVKVIGVEPEGVDVLRQSLMSGTRVTIEEPSIDGIWVPQLGAEVYRLCDTLVDDVVTVNDEDICSAIRDCFEDTRALLEPAGATSIAGLKKWVAQQHGEGSAAPGQYVAVASDACNIEFDFLGRVQAGGASIVSIGDMSKQTGVRR